jgi:DNA-binding NtrC family response regulator
VYEQASVLIYGRDPSLLESRRKILRHGGYRVVAISQMTELTQLQATEFQVFVLCHTLTPEDQQEALAVSHEANPELRAIIMTAYAPEFLPGPMASFLSPFDGPKELIHQVRKAVEKSAGGYAYQGHMGNRTVSVKHQVLEQQPSVGWMYTGHAGQTCLPVSFSSSGVNRRG